MKLQVVVLSVIILILRVEASKGQSKLPRKTKKTVKSLGGRVEANLDKSRFVALLESCSDSGKIKSESSKASPAKPSRNPKKGNNRGANSGSSGKERKTRGRSQESKSKKRRTEDLTTSKGQGGPVYTYNLPTIPSLCNSPELATIYDVLAAAPTDGINSDDISKVRGIMLGIVKREGKSLDKQLKLYFSTVNRLIVSVKENFPDGAEPELFEIKKQ